MILTCGRKAKCNEKAPPPPKIAASTVFMNVFLIHEKTLAVGWHFWAFLTCNSLGYLYNYNIDWHLGGNKKK